MTVNRLMLMVGLSVGVLCFVFLLKINPSLPLWANIGACTAFGIFAAFIARAIINR
jgi:hypothetical protein